MAISIAIPRLSLLPILLVAALSGAASAQIDGEALSEYMPLEVGNEWSYSIDELYCDHIAYGGECRRTVRSATYRVVGREVQGADTMAVLDGPGTRALYGVSASGAGFIFEVLRDSVGVSPVVPFAYAGYDLQTALARGPQPWSGTIGGIAYDGEQMFVFPGHLYLQGIGLYGYYSEWRGTGGARSEVRWTLTGAVVGGHNYGAFATASTPTPLPEAAGVVVYPNPATQRATIRVESASSPLVRVDMHDALGRTVWSGVVRTGALAALPLGGLSPGVYGIRVLEGARMVARTVLTVGR